MKIIGMISVFNEADIIEEIINYYESQGVKLVVLDNGSTDGSFQICEKFVGREIVRLRRYTSKFWKTSTIFRMLYDMALTQSPQWIVLISADEFLECPQKDMTLREGMKNADKEGFNLIQFDRFDFFMTENDTKDLSIKNRMKFYSYQDDFVYRAWKYFPGIIPNYKSGHYPIFPVGHRYKILPQKFILRHYPFRSKEQAQRRMKDRLERKPSIKIKKEKTGHYQKILENDFSQTVYVNNLTRYEENNQWNFEKKYTPFIEKHPLKDELFSDKGILKDRPKRIQI